MKTAALKYPVLTTLVGLTTVIFTLLPFHAFLTIWLSSLMGHYTLFRLWKEAILVVCAIGALYLIITDHKIRTHTLTRRLVWLIIFYLALQIAVGLVALAHHDVTQKALGYGLVVNLRFLVFFLVTWSVALRTQRLRANWPRFALWPAVVVIAIGLLQITVLPHDFLRHFGYGPNTIYPFETINHNQHYIRIMSTLRGANPLGTYLIIPLAAWFALVLRKQRSWATWAFLVAGLIVLVFSFSRSAWLGTFVAMAIVAVYSLNLRKLAKPLAVAAVIVVCFVVGLGLGWRHSSRAQNIFLHTETHSTVKDSSNNGHRAALKRGISDVVHQPLGRGVGTAGPASIYNNKPARIAENYFLQIGQESGVIGMFTFALICAAVGYLLYVRRADPLALSLFASLIGITLVSLLSHAWTDDTLAYIWWGLAGIAMVPIPEAAKPAKTKA